MAVRNAARYRQRLVDRMAAKGPDGSVAVAQVRRGISCGWRREWPAHAPARSRSSLGRLAILPFARLSGRREAALMMRS